MYVYQSIENNETTVNAPQRCLLIQCLPVIHLLRQRRNVGHRSRWFEQLEENCVRFSRRYTRLHSRKMSSNAKLKTKESGPFLKWEIGSPFLHRQWRHIYEKKAKIIANPDDRKRVRQCAFPELEKKLTCFVSLPRSRRLPVTGAAIILKTLQLRDEIRISA